MISFPSHSDIVLFHTPVSFGCGIDGMCRYCRILLRRELMERAYFLFINRSREQVRVFWYDGQGFSLCETQRPLPLLENGTILSSVHSVHATRTKP